MRVDGRQFRTIFLSENGKFVSIIDQRYLPHEFRLVELESLRDAASAIADMQVRGAPLIGVTAAFGMALAMSEAADDNTLTGARDTLLATRPTAVNLRWALDRVYQELILLVPSARCARAFQIASAMAEEDMRTCSSIGEVGLELIRDIYRVRDRSEPINILTHCNAGWLATVDWGTALAPIYKASIEGIPIHVWVDETRPRNQGFSLTAWELDQQKIPHSLIVDNAGGHLMQSGQVDLCLVGADRVTRNGDVCNKIGTYLKALAAFDNNVPFHVALPLSTVDWTMSEGVGEIPIEQTPTTGG